MKVVTDARLNGKLEVVHESLSTTDGLAAVFHTDLNQYWVVDFEGDIKLSGGLDLEMAVDSVERLRKLDNLEPWYNDPAYARFIDEQIDLARGK